MAEYGVHSLSLAREDGLRILICAPKRGALVTEFPSGVASAASGEVLVELPVAWPARGLVKDVFGIPIPFVSIITVPAGVSVSLVSRNSLDEGAFAMSTAEADGTFSALVPGPDSCVAFLARDGRAAVVRNPTAEELSTVTVPSTVEVRVRSKNREAMRVRLALVDALIRFEANVELTSDDQEKSIAVPLAGDYSVIAESGNGRTRTHIIVTGDGPTLLEL